eukprot:TRINITY_DN17475_c0_g1_i1.p1 TRINITY_DN17475_c0_g1~~TRINITY_DN17475_c0_g1_i1.p1  ORF type:complete len:180 (-),score=75.31 TRINITY_DN17475_c0_g1_i1:185-724(-)
MFRGKRQEVAAIKRELTGEREVRLLRLEPDGGTDEGERRRQLIWQNFRIHNGTSSDPKVLGEEHPDYCEGKEAAQGNTSELFDSELLDAGLSGVHVDRLAKIHSHWFGSGFEKSVGKKLRQFVKDKYEYDEKTGLVKAQTKMINAMRKMEAREIIGEIQEQNEAKKHRKWEVPKKPAFV